VVAAALLARGTDSAIAQPPAEGDIQSFYFDTLRHSEIWINVTPPPGAGDRSSGLTLNITARFAGKVPAAPVTTPPDAIVVRAQSSAFYRPTLVRLPQFEMIADGVALWGPDLPVNFYSAGTPSEGATATQADTVDVTIPASALRHLARAMSIAGNAMGIEFTLKAPQIAAIQRFAARVLPAEEKVADFGSGFRRRLRQQGR
jgi:hypothetical protein